MVLVEGYQEKLIRKNRQRLLKMMAIADDRDFSYDNETELVQFIASEMEKEGLDITNEENIDSYLNTAIDRVRHYLYTVKGHFNLVDD